VEENMFAPPTRLPTRVFARLPASLNSADETNDWVAGQPLGTHAGSLLEGPAFDRDGNFWCVDVQNGRIFTVSREGAFRLAAQYDGWPNGLKIHRDGRVFIADHKHGIMLLDPATGKVTPWLERYNVERFKGLNDLCIAANGDLYFTDQGLTGLHDPTGRVFRVRSNGEITCLLDNVPSPNGLVLNPDETALFVAATRGNCIWHVPFLRNGGVGKAGLFVQLSGAGGPDGLALDEEGRLVVAHVRLGCAWVFDRFGEPVYRIDSCAGRMITNVAYGWPDRTTLYITESESGCILTADLDVPGKLMDPHR
jgi:gluconolactonase